MSLPSDIRRMVVEAIRCPDDEFARFDTRRLRREKWLEENRTLSALSLTSRMWTTDAIAGLWSEVHIEDELSAEDWEAQTRMLEKCIQIGHNISLKRLTILLHTRNPTHDHFETSLHHILAQSTVLRCLQVFVNGRWRPLLHHLGTLTFPNLRVLGVLIPWANVDALDEERPMEEFLTKHRTLEVVESNFVSSTPICNASHWEDLRKSNPLPKLRTFRGHLSDLQILNSSQHLRTLELGEMSDFFRSLSRMANPFPNVIHLTFSPPHHISFGTVSLKALSESFPSLRIVDGFRLSKAFLEFMKSQSKSLEPSPHLSGLRVVTFYETCGSDSYMFRNILPLADASVERAFKGLRTLFPAIVSAKHVKYEYVRLGRAFDTRKDVSNMEMHYLPGSGSSHLETRVERKGPSMTVSVI
ncbi:hypothetical protein SISNIDRAFT_450215 [Sistotremastrum niveocremeum HHB9708]|uniref:F-box domain-containing protein n=1 Tax=Sistotremastrum niveocremeum HHB9708 TaxID=1314777 RepID=A0A164Z0E3_9AGAM|nr:hypothetical protein SISNIDRAFT_450215 [Sistotremastrum niveocremeum HHB9708]